MKEKHFAVPKPKKTCFCLRSNNILRTHISGDEDMQKFVLKLLLLITRMRHFLFSETMFYRSSSHGRSKTFCLFPANRPFSKTAAENSNKLKLKPTKG